MEPANAMLNESTTLKNDEVENPAILEDVCGASLEIPPSDQNSMDSESPVEDSPREENESQMDDGLADINAQLEEAADHSLADESGVNQVTEGADPAELAETTLVSKQESLAESGKLDAEAVESESVQSESVQSESESVDEEIEENGDPTFMDLPLSDEVQAAIRQSGYEHPTPIQNEIIPHMLFGRDVLAQSQTGTGKTAAFALPILTRVDTQINEPQVLVMAPTRELAIQVAKSFETYGSELKGFRCAVIYGGQDYEIQYRQLRKGPQVIVGTPGRLIDHVKNNKLDISEIECLVLDEADEMLNMGFLPDVEFILDQLPEERHIALFSATMPAPIRKISQRYLHDPVKITIKTKTLTADSIRQRAVVVSPRDRADVLIRFLEAEDADGAIVFTRTRETTTIVADKLTRAGLKAFALNGEMPQRARERTIEKLKAGHLDILVATDIAARGLDVSRVSHVFNYDLPENPEAYTHRIGRTGRAGKTGEAIIFATRSQRGRLKQIEKATRQKIEFVDPPTASVINKMRVKRFYNQVTQALEAGDLEFFEKLVQDFASASDQPLEKIAAAMVKVSRDGREFLMKENPFRENKRGEDRGNKREHSGKGERRGFSGQPESGMARFRLAVGRRDGVRPGNIVGAVTNEANMDGEDVGSIQIHHSFSTVDLPADRAEEIIEALSETRIAGRRIQIRSWEERDGADRPRRGKPKRHGGGRYDAKPQGRGRKDGRKDGRKKSKSNNSDSSRSFSPKAVRTRKKSR